jgi:hypothetical protein
MHYSHILYHQNNQEDPDKATEDYYSHSDNIFVVADGITHDRDENGQYPNPSDSAEVAKIICREINEYLSDHPQTATEIKNAFTQANSAVERFNINRPLYQNRESNAYNIGAATVALACIMKGKLIYGVLDDCFISVFSDDLIDKPTLRGYVQESAALLDENFDWSTKETRKLWRKNIRNNVYPYKGRSYGYGALDGRSGYEKYLQIGQVKLKDGDLICVYTDGFMKLLKIPEFVSHIKNCEFDPAMYKYINSISQHHGVNKEKTCYLIKYYD